jgi:hypothetical protein
MKNLGIEPLKALTRLSLLMTTDAAGRRLFAPRAKKIAAPSVTKQGRKSKAGREQQSENKILANK